MTSQFGPRSTEWHNPAGSVGKTLADRNLEKVCVTGKNAGSHTPDQQSIDVTIPAAGFVPIWPVDRALPLEELLEVVTKLIHP